MRYGKARMSGTNDSITKVCIGDGFFVQEWHPCKGYGPVNSTVENGVQFPTNGCQSL